VIRLGEGGGPAEDMKSKVKEASHYHYSQREPEITRRGDQFEERDRRPLERERGESKQASTSIAGKKEAKRPKQKKERRGSNGAYLRSKSEATLHGV